MANAQPARVAERDRIVVACMLALTFTTGIADAIGYLGLDRVFTANMTGNVVILGMALAAAMGVQASCARYIAVKDRSEPATAGGRS